MTAILRSLTGIVVAVIAATAVACGPTHKPTTVATAPWTLSDGGWWATVTSLPPTPGAINPTQPTQGFSISSDLLFYFGSSDLSGQANGVIADITAKLMSSDVSIAIHGFCDDVGPPSVNLPLSLARARAVEHAMVSDGFPRARIATVDGYGSAQPRALPPDTPSNRAINRRVELEILHP